MKKRILILTALLACLSIASCSNEQNESSGESKSENLVISADEATDAPTETPTELLTEVTKPTAVKVTLSGEPDDTFTAENDCYAESDRVTMYFRKGVAIKGDMIKLTEKAMDDISEATGLEFNNIKLPFDERKNLLDTYFEPNTFNNINPDSLKTNVIVTDLGNESEWSTTQSIIMDQYDFTPDNFAVLYHELSHVVQTSDGIGLGSMMNEGFAVYTANKVLFNQNIPTWDASIYLSSYDFEESLVYGGDDSFKCDFSILGDFNIDTNYNYGFRFVTFLYNTYGENIFNDIIAEAVKQGYKDIYEGELEPAVNKNTKQLLSIIKTVTSDDVLTEFNQWYDQNWESLSQKYYAYMDELSA